MPHANGFDVLAWRTERPDLLRLPVVVLSSSSQPKDIAAARQFGAQDFKTKPNNPQDLVRILQDLDARWLTTIPLTQPPNAPNPTISDHSQN